MSFQQIEALPQQPIAACPRGGFFNPPDGLYCHHEPDLGRELKPVQGFPFMGVRLAAQKNDIWVADLVRAILPSLFRKTAGEWVIGGDFNYSATFDQKEIEKDVWVKNDRGNQEYLDGMRALELEELLFSHQKKLTPTF